MTTPYPLSPPADQIMTGDLWTPGQVGPPDMYPSQMAPSTKLRLMSQSGRFLAGVGATDADPSAQYQSLTEERMDQMQGEEQDYPDELQHLQNLDDVMGSGIFDPAMSHQHVHPDAGVFASDPSLPGYVAREKFYQPSEVIDANTGQPVVYVPGGAVAVDPRTPSALELLALFEPGYYADPNVPAVPTWNAPGAAQSVGAEEPAPPVPEKEPASLAMIAISFGVMGAAVGLFVGTLMKRKKGR